jgi:hypothetical protein
VDDLTLPPGAIVVACEECEKPFVRKLQGGRPKRFCSRECYSRAYDRHPDDTKYTRKEATCEICSTPFLKTKRSQKYCSRICFGRSWRHKHREEHNARVRARRHLKPEWYREREPIYSSRHRSKLESSKPWAYLLLSARSRAKEKNITYELDDDWARSRWTGFCEITKLPFAAGYKGHGPHPFSPSVDRIDSKIGYTQTNTRFILWGCNATKGIGTDFDMYFIAKAIIENMPEPSQ